MEGLEERCPECQREEPKPWPVYTVRLSDGVERCARCLRALGPSWARPVQVPQTSVIQPGSVVQWPLSSDPPPDWWRRTGSLSASLL